MQPNYTSTIFRAGLGCYPCCLHTTQIFSLPRKNFTSAAGKLCKKFNPCRRSARSRLVLRAEEGEEEKVVYNTEFGYSRKDVLLIGVLTLGLGYGLYYGLQAGLGLDEFQAGSTTQLVVFLGVLLTWVITYLFRVGSKKMTYVTQLKDYEEAVMQKRLEEMTEAELEILLEEVEKEKQEATRERKL